MTSEPPTLITTKLQQPPVAENMVHRPRLVELMNHGLSRPLTLVCAAAGFGKTTLVSSWLAQHEEFHMTAKREGFEAQTRPPMQHLRHAWLSLDKDDSDLLVFLGYFVAALRTIFDDACPKTQELVYARQQPLLELVAATLVNEIALLPKSFVLVLDDYSSIRGQAVHELLNRLVQHRPQPMHLVLVARRNPPLPLARLRANGQISEIRSRELRFTPEETAAFLNQVLPAPLDQSVLALLEQRIEGWIAGLQLASLALRESIHDEAALAILSSSDVQTAEYLAGEVLSRQPQTIQRFLLRTSILDRFCAPLCEALVGTEDPKCTAQACLEWIERANLFVIAMDHQQEWYRYHHLFQEMLQHRLRDRFGPDEVIRLHRRAASWFAERGLIDEALRHALAASDLEQAASMMEHELCDVLNRDDRPTLDRWLRLLPEELIARRPWLLMIKAWALNLSGQLDAVSSVVREVEALVDEDRGEMLGTDDLYGLKSLRGQILGLRGQEAYMNNQPARAQTCCQQALELIPKQWMHARGGLMLYLSMSMQALGQGDAAERMLLDHYRSLGEKTDAYAIRLLHALTFNRLQSGRLELARQSAKEMLHHATRSGLPALQGWAHYFLGSVYQQWNDLAEAGQHFSQLVDKRYVVHPHAARNGLIGMALVHQARGESAAAWQMMDLLDEFDLDLVGYETDETISLRARLLMLEGDIRSACRWADAATAPVPDQGLIWLENRHITRASILLARGAGADSQLALAIVDAIHEIAQRTHNTRFQIASLVLRARALDAGGRTDKAETALRQAVELAQPGGFIRVFIDGGLPVQDLLGRLAKQGFATETIQRILAAFPDRQPAAGVGATKMRPGQRRMSLGDAGLVEPLTPRETEILTLLGEPISGKEIAQRLFISTATLKRHTSNIYGKLGVHRRWDAVKAAESLGIVPPR